MSRAIVEVAEVAEVLPHPNADRLCLARIKGWQSVIRKNEDGTAQFAPGERVVYVPPGCTVPRELARRLGIESYLAERTDATGERRLVVRQVRLRGEPSFGLVLAPENSDWAVGDDVREHYGIGKYEPPLRASAGDAEPEHPHFPRYTEVENLRNFPDVLEPGEEVVVTEKIHGTNARLGLVEGRQIAGSHRLQRKRPEDGELTTNTYWYPFTLEPVQTLLDELGRKHEVVILYGEVFGRPVQKLAYGHHGKLGFAAFDLFLDGDYQDHDVFEELLRRHGVPSVPLLHRGPYDPDHLDRLSAGQTTYDDQHIREGVVVKPATERRHPKLGRVILKRLNDDYVLNKKYASADTTDV